MNRIETLMPFGQYRAAEGVNKSLLDWMRPTPAHCKAYMDGLTPQKETEALTFGRIVHAAVLENVFDYYVKPDGMKFSTKEGKEWKAEREDKEIIDHEEFQDLAGMLASVQKHSAYNLIKTGNNEISLFAKDEPTGLLRKCRLDCVPNRKLFNGPVPILDVKTALSAEKRDFEKEILNRRYHVQAAYSLDIANTLGLDREGFVFVVIEKAAPYAVAIYELSETFIQLGRKEYRRDLDMFAKCKETRIWPAYTSDIELIECPSWLLEKAA